MIINYQLHLTILGFNFCKPNSHKLYFQYKTQYLPYGHTPNNSHSIFQIQKSKLGIILQLSFIMHHLI